MSLPDHHAIGAVSFTHEAGHLKQVPRAGWTLAGVRSGESVAEHSFRVAILAYVIATHEGADAEHAATLGLFHDIPETRVGDVPSVGKRYVDTADPRRVITDQTAALGEPLAEHIIALISEHESAKTAEATPESRCSRDADKLECLLQAREYQREGYTQLDLWITSSTEALTTPTGKQLADTALQTSPGQWWDHFAQNYSTPIT